MKDPQFGSNRKQSFIDFETTRGKVRFGLEELLLFAEFAGSRVNLTDESGYIKLLDGLDITDGELSRSTPVLTTPVTTVSIKEYGDGHNFVDVLTLTDFIVGHIPAAAAALGIGNIVASFPGAPGFHIEEVYYQELKLQLPGTPVNADLGLGSVVASGAVSLLSGTGTFEDRLTGQTNATAASYGSLVKAMARMPLTGISVNLNNSVKDIYLNAAGTWNVNNHGDLLCAGTIVVKWTKIV